MSDLMRTPERLMRLIVSGGEIVYRHDGTVYVPEPYWDLTDLPVDHAYGLASLAELAGKDTLLIGSDRAAFQILTPDNDGGAILRDE